MDSKLKVLKRRRILGFAAAGMIILSAWPTRYLASPSWDVQVVTDAGQPIAQINVRLVYQDYSAESESHEVTLRTDEKGSVVFPQRYERASIFQRAFYTMSSAGAGVHASFGRHAYVFAFGNGREGFAVTGKYLADWHGNPDSMHT